MRRGAAVCYHDKKEKPAHTGGEKNDHEQPDLIGTHNAGTRFSPGGESGVCLPVFMFGKGLLFV